MGEHTIYISYQNGSYNFPILEADEIPLYHSRFQQTLQPSR